jgi:DNA-directed RNA polymerase subunit E'/Rpb7
MCSIYLILPTALWPWGHLCLLTEMITGNLPGVVNGGWRVRLTFENIFRHISEILQVQFQITTIK